MNRPSGPDPGLTVPGLPVLGLTVPGLTVPGLTIPGLTRPDLGTDSVLLIKSDTIMIGPGCKTASDYINYIRFNLTFLSRMKKKR